MAANKNPYGKISLTFSIGRIRALESSLLSSSDFSAMIDADTYYEALKLLIDTGYGSDESNSTNKNISLDNLVDNELAKTSKTISELSPDNSLTELFFLDIDAHNFKVYLKSKLTGEDPNPLILDGGTINPEILRICVETEDYSLLSDTFCYYAKGIENIDNSRILSTMVDKAMFKYIFNVLDNSHNKLIKEYFYKRAELIDINTILRAKNLNYTDKEISEMLINDSDFSKNIPNNISLIDAERNMNKSLIKILRDKKGDSSSIAPVICFLMDKKNEALNLRLLFAAKQSGKSVDLNNLDL